MPKAPNTETVQGEAPAPLPEADADVQLQTQQKEAQQTVKEAAKKETPGTGSY